MTLTHLPSRHDWLSEGASHILSNLFIVASSHQGVKGKRFAATICKDGIFTPYGVNSYKTSPLQLKYAENPFKIYLHAEIEALSRATRKCGGDVEGATAFVIRLSADGKLASAKPCSGCMAALTAFGIKEVCYS